MADIVISGNENPLLAVEYRGEHMVITLRIQTPIATQQFFQAIVTLLAERLRATRAPSPGDIEMASWQADGSADAR